MDQTEPDEDSPDRCTECHGFGLVLVNMALNPVYFTERQSMACPACGGTGKGDDND